MRQQQKKKKVKTILNNDIEKKNDKYISIPSNFLNIDPSYQTETTIHKKNYKG
jgi:hypothetical protein